MSGFGIRTAFDIARKSLRAQLAGLNVTGNNIANVNTKGFSRQEVTLVSDFPIITPDGIFGSGVKLEGVRRIRDKLVDRQLRNEMHTKGKNEALERVLNQIETTFNEPSETGLRVLLSQFFDNFHALANDPENATTRFNLRESSKVLIESFYRIDKQSRVLSDDIDFELRRSVETLNSLTAQIAELNSQIVAVEGASKGGANDLRDQRDRVLDDISELIDIFPLEKPNGTVDVAAQAQTLVTSNFSFELEVVTKSENDNLISEIIVSETGNIFEANNGKIFALVQARNEIIPHFRDLLNELANGLITKVNDIHRTGVGLQGTALEIPKNNDFFTGDSAANIDLSQAIKDDVNAIAAASRVDTLLENGQIVTSGSPGDNKIALEIANLKLMRVLSNGTESLIDFFDSIIGEVGIAAKEAHDNVLNEERIITQFQNIRDSTSGVSLDEEFVNLIKYQRGFQAGARLITTIDDMFETLINM